MAASFEPKSDSSRIQPDSPIPSETNNVEEWSSLLLSKVDSSDVEKMREYWKKEVMKVKSPLPPRQPKTSSPPEKSRVSLSLDMAIEFELVHGRKLDANMDTKLLRRTISNRLSAQRSRMKRSQYITDMEKRVDHLEEVVASLTSQIESYSAKKNTLQLENDSLREVLDLRAAESNISEEKLDEKRREIRELKEALTKDKDELSPKPYSLEFYQERLMQLEMNQFISQELNPHQGSTIDDDDQEEEVDQYLNLEEELDRRPADV